MNPTARAAEFVRTNLRPLRKVDVGHYKSKDERYTFTRDPTGGDHLIGWGWASWLVFDETLGRDEGALTVGGATHHASLKSTLQGLAWQILADKAYDPSTGQIRPDGWVLVTEHTHTDCAADCNEATFKGPVCATCLCCQGCARAYDYAPGGVTTGKVCPGCKFGPTPAPPKRRSKVTDPRHPLNYACPSCAVKRFASCRTKAGKVAKAFHGPRARKAVERGGPW